jgi:hypothetical protein
MMPIHWVASHRHVRSNTVTAYLSQPIQLLALRSRCGLPPGARPAIGIPMTAMYCGRFRHIVRLTASRTYSLMRRSNGYLRVSAIAKRSASGCGRLKRKFHVQGTMALGNFSKMVFLRCRPACSRRSPVQSAPARALFPSILGMGGDHG